MFRIDLLDKVVTTITGVFRKSTEKNNSTSVEGFDTMEEISDENGFIFSVYDDNNLKKDFYIPEEILTLILSFVDFDDLILRCRLVCHSWKDVIEGLAIRLKGEREYSLQLEKSIVKADQKRLIFPWFIYYFCHKNLFGRNLLKNNCAQNEFKHWEILSNGGDRWKTEQNPQGSEELPEDDDFEGSTSCFATSYHSNSKVQVIDLLKEGFVPKIMDEIQPVIKISEWFAGRFDCGCVYELKVALLDKSKKPIADFEQRESIRQWEGNHWKKVEHEFSGYGPGVRYIAFQHSGTDSQFWAGHYGSKMAGGVVKLYYDPQKSKA